METVGLTMTFVSCNNKKDLLLKLRLLSDNTCIKLDTADRSIVMVSLYI